MVYGISFNLISVKLCLIIYCTPHWQDYDYVLVAKQSDKDEDEAKRKAFLEKLEAKGLEVTVSPERSGKLCNEDSRAIPL